MTERSAATLKAASTLIPGGLWAGSGSWFGHASSAVPTPVLPVITKGKGATVTDVDGNEYIDFICGQGSLILGHAEDRVVAAITKAVAKGYSFGAPVESELRLAELIAGRFSSIDMLELVNTPQDAFRHAIRIARARTGRELIISCGGRRYAEEAIEAIPYNDSSACDTVFRERAGAIAAVVVEPTRTHGGLETLSDSCVTKLREFCNVHDALLISDETVTGFRLRTGQGIVADLTIVGPVIGGGLPLAAVGGRRAIMERERSCSGALARFGNVPAMAAGIATLQATAEPDFYAALDQQASRLDEGLRAASAAVGLDVAHARVGSMVGVALTGGKSAGSRGANAAARYARFHEAMLNHGVLLGPTFDTCLFVSAGHTGEDIDRAIAASHEAFKETRY